MRYIIIDPKEGVFLGTRERPDTGDYGMLFSRNNMFEITKATAWDNRAGAEKYLNRYVKQFCPFSYVVEIDSNEDYVDIVDIIRSGYGDCAHDMMNFIPMYSDSIH